MRIVRYTDPVIEGLDLWFHPRLTVVSGLPDPVRERLAATLAAIPRGTEPVGRGLMEVHGVRLDLTLENLELLGCDRDIDAVLTADELPGAPGSDEDPDEALTAAQGDLRDADEQYRQVQQSAAETRRQLDDLYDEQVTLSRQIDGARGGLDSFAEANLFAAEEELASLRRAASEVGDVDGDLAEQAAAADILDRRISEAATARDLLAHTDPEPVRTAYRALKLALEPSRVPDPVAQRLADELAQADARRRQALVAGGHEAAFSRASARRQMAVSAVMEAEREQRAPKLSPALVEELESVRDEYFAAERSGKRSLGKSRRMTSLKHRQDELLDQLGFVSWQAYLLGVTDDPTALERQQRHREARAALAEAEGMVHQTNAARRNDPVVKASQDEVDRLSEQARQLLGRDVTDLEGALRSRTIEAQAEGVDQAAQQLSRALAVVGVQPAGSPAELEGQARTWLVARERLTEELEERDEELVALRTERKLLGERIARLTAAASQQQPEAAFESELAEAQDRIARAGERLSSHRDAVARLSELRARDELLRGHHDELTRQLQERERLVAHAAEVRHEIRTRLSQLEEQVQLRVTNGAPDRRQAGDGPGAVEWYVLARLAQQRSVSYAGSVPMVVDDAFAGREFGDLGSVLGRLERMAEAVQVIWLTDDSGVRRWADELSDSVADVIDFAAPGPGGQQDAEEHPVPLLG
ncbi:MAG: hypothetical protein R2754_03650 [Microthrixaceae bacterium]